MKTIFEKCMELDSEVSRMAGKADIIGIEVNTAMKTYQDCEDKKVAEKFLGRRYLELAEQLVEYGFIKKEWA